MNNIQIPAPLDNTKIHSPAVVRKWQHDMADYHAAKRNEELDAERKRQAEMAHANRVLNDDEYHQLAIQRENQKREKELERQVAELAKEKAKQEYLASSPEEVEISEHSDAEMLRLLQHWIQRGYEINFEAARYFQPGFYNIRLSKQKEKQ
jgi:actin-related protein